MKIFWFLTSTLLTILLICFLNNRWQIGGFESPRFGMFLSPQHGFWQNAADKNESFDGDLQFPQIKNKASVYFDERLVPHVFAENEEDVYFIQGYLHAKFRLWQMEFQTFAAAGRLTEILGPGKNDVYLNYDRQMRRLGMVFGAEHTLVEMEADPDSKRICEAYTNGVNTYIKSLRKSELPLEYKLLDYEPELWSMKKIALFIKYMSYDLSGAERDFEFTNAKAVFSKEDFNKIYPIFPDSLDPIAPAGTNFPASPLGIQAPATADSLYLNAKESALVHFDRPDKDNGSNNWAVAGSRTASGKPILSNDPHLGLNLPSLWYEIQLQGPGFNTNGVSFAGVPSVVIGFNDSCAWGFTNAMRDVRDYYEVKFKDNSRKEYWFDSAWHATTFKVETHSMPDGGVFLDTVAYTNIGPVMYDQHFNGMGRVKDGKSYAVRWKAHDPTNEWRMFYQLSYAKNYQDYLAAIQHMGSTGQSCLFASKSGDIAIWQQADFPAKWKRQGDFVMPGYDSSYFWQAYIPSSENVHQLNPERGFVSSANQLPADSAYPYYIGGRHDVYRGKIINRKLEQMHGITPEDMQHLQNDTYNLLAETAIPLLLRNLNRSDLSKDEKRFFDYLQNWDKFMDANSKGATVFYCFYETLAGFIWNDEFSKVQGTFVLPESATLIDNLLKDSSFSFIDNINTDAKESLQEIITASFIKTVKELLQLESKDQLVWSRYKNTGIRHLLQLPALSRFNLITGGGENVINATKKFHGPSWKMVVHLNTETEAYGIYPGGQNGNAGSKYYDNFVNDWAEGKYYKLWMMKKEEQNDPRVQWVLNFNSKS